MHNLNISTIVLLYDTCIVFISFLLFLKKKKTLVNLLTDEIIYINIFLMVCIFLVRQ